MRSAEEPDGAHNVRVVTGPAVLEGDLSSTPDARGVVLFAHGSGSSRMSPRNRSVAAELRRGGLSTLLVDLLTRDEERVDEVTRRFRFDIGLLAERLGNVAAWLSREPVTSDLDIGCFGASTGAAAALVCAAEFPHLIAAVVSRGGRPDLAGEKLPLVRAPTLLIVGGADHEVMELNAAALSRLQCVKRLDVVPGATHLFEEPGTLDTAARLARSWFQQHLGGR